MRPLTLAAGLALLATAATAHPESPVMLRLLIGIEAGKATYLGESWTFDEPTSAWLLETYDADGSGAFEPGELPDLQQAVAENTAPSTWLTRAFAQADELTGLAAYGFQASVAEGAVTVAFALALPAPVDPAALRVEMTDANAFLALTPVADAPVTFRGDLAATCVPKIERNLPTATEGEVLQLRLSFACSGG